MTVHDHCLRYECVPVPDGTCMCVCDDCVAISAALLAENAPPRPRVWLSEPRPACVPVSFPLTPPDGLMIPAGETATLFIEPHCVFRPKHFVVRQLSAWRRELEDLVVIEVRIGNRLVFDSRLGFYGPEGEGESEPMTVAALHRNGSLLMDTMQPRTEDPEGLPVGGTRAYLRVQNRGPRALCLSLDVEGVGVAAAEPKRVREGKEESP